ncbi:MAG: hypothetical protein ACFFDQ_09075, partial [Candidatus Thorarchaeota archaeon]
SGFLSLLLQLFNREFFFRHNVSPFASFRRAILARHAGWGCSNPRLKSMLSGENKKPHHCIDKINDL